VLAAQTYEQPSSRRQTTALQPQLLLLPPQALLLLRVLPAVRLAVLPLQQLLRKVAVLHLGLRCCSSSIHCMRSVS
jgi:hypothetical protein